MAKSDELVKYITQRVVHFMDTPKEERKGRTKAKEPWAMKWFGMLPFAVSLWVGKKEKALDSGGKMQKRSSSGKG
ncbi:MULTISPECIES: YqzE family protein [Paenibacillus]|uniref:YqzE family protein n=1 Tax=Paenibacillus xylanilyticus TaxID=248903 RepID=A0A7Y6EYU0_9BACL|nr:YqzE family protein [Paenibacillus xylanilyticus]NUU80291.1 YqzE family protein [Paenibacillus xylanilyticus]